VWCASGAGSSLARIGRPGIFSVHSEGQAEKDLAAVVVWIVVWIVVWSAHRGRDSGGEPGPFGQRHEALVAPDQFPPLRPAPQPIIDPPRQDRLGIRW
jgi:hypothetical protein